MNTQLLEALLELAGKIEDFAGNHAYYDECYELRSYARNLEEAAGRLAEIIGVQINKMKKENSLGV
jgi:hypothetical protein